MTERKFTIKGKDGITCDQSCLRFQPLYFERTNINGRDVCAATSAPIIEGMGENVNHGTLLRNMRTCLVKK